MKYAEGGRSARGGEGSEGCVSASAGVSAAVVRAVFCGNTGVNARKQPVYLLYEACQRFYRSL